MHNVSCILAGTQYTALQLHNADAVNSAIPDNVKTWMLDSVKKKWYLYIESHMLQGHLACPGLRERLLHGANDFVNVTPTGVNDRNAHVPRNKVGEMSSIIQVRG